MTTRAGVSPSFGFPSPSLIPGAGVEVSFAFASPARGAGVGAVEANTIRDVSEVYASFSVALKTTGGASAAAARVSSSPGAQQQQQQQQQQVGRGGRLLEITELDGGGNVSRVKSTITAAAVPASSPAASPAPLPRKRMLEITELDVDGSSNGFGRRAVADPTSFAIPVGAKETQQRVSTKLREKISSLEMESFSLQTRAELHRTSAESGAPGVRRGVSEESTFSLPHHQQQQQKQPAHAQPHAHAHEQHFDASSAEPVVSVRKRPVFSGTPNASRVAEMLQRAGMLQQ